MATLSDVRTSIKSTLVVNGTDYDTQIDDAIRSALRQQRGKKYWFLKKIGTFTLSSGNSSAIITSTLTDFSAPDTFSISDGSTWYQDGRGFDFISYEKLERDWLVSATLPSGRPLACAVFDGTLYTSHLANQNYTIRASYYQQDATLPATGAATSIWFDEGYDLIKALAMYIFKRDDQQYSLTEEDGSRVRDCIAALNQTSLNYEMGRQ
jgi:hypothetical protein